MFPHRNDLKSITRKKSYSLPDKSCKAASLDIGANTIRLLIARIDKDNRFVPIARKRQITRLGEGFLPRKEITLKAMERSAKAVFDFSRIIKEKGVKQVFAAATSVVREAKNRDNFTSRIFADTGIRIRVISGEEEASLSLKGVFRDVFSSKNKFYLVFDVGGGSTELIFSQGNRPIKTASLNLGAVYLTESSIMADPPLIGELRLLESKIEKVIKSFYPDFCTLKERLFLGKDQLFLIGTAGTATTLAAVDMGLEVYDPGKINNYRLTEEAVKGIYQRLIAVTKRERIEMPGLEKGREDIIVAGGLVVLKIMEIFGLNEFFVSDAGLLEGLLADGLEDLPNFPKADRFSFSGT